MTTRITISGTPPQDPAERSRAEAALNYELENCARVLMGEMENHPADEQRDIFTYTFTFLNPAPADEDTPYEVEYLLCQEEEEGISWTTRWDLKRECWYSFDEGRAWNDGMKAQTEAIAAGGHAAGIDAGAAFNRAYEQARSEG